MYMYVVYMSIIPSHGPNIVVAFVVSSALGYIMMHSAATLSAVIINYELESELVFAFVHTLNDGQAKERSKEIR